MRLGQNEQKIKSQLQEGEQVLWQGRPHLLFFVLKGNHISTFVGVIAVLAGCVALIQQNLGGLAAIVIGLLISAAMPLYRFAIWQSTYYLITATKILMIEGVLGVTPTIIPFTGISKVSVDSSFFETITGGIVSSITLTLAPAAGQIFFGTLPQVTLKEIAHPQEVAHYIQIPQQNNTTQTVQLSGFPTPAIPAIETTQTLTTTYQTSSSISETSS